MASAPSTNPSAYLNGYVAPVNNVLQLTISGATNPLLSGLTAAQANPTTGDIRKVYLELCKMMERSANNVPDSSNPTGNLTVPRDPYASTSTDTTILANRKSHIMTAISSSSVDSSTATPTVTTTYVFTFKQDVASLSVSAE